MTYTTFARAPALALALALAAAACTLPAHADSFASSASSAGSASSGSISDSIGGSSNSSSGDNKRAETGPYRVIDIAQAPARAGITRITLRAVAGDAATQFWVDVPDRALAERRVARDEVVQVNERVYGYEFAYGDTKKPFFLALQDDWYRELSSRKVTI
jgi:hypothetical protein